MHCWKSTLATLVSLPVATLGTNPDARRGDTRDGLLHNGEAASRYRRNDWSWTPAQRAKHGSDPRTPSGLELDRMGALLPPSSVSGVEQDCIPFIYSYSFLDQWACGADPTAHRRKHHYKPLGARPGKLGSLRDGWHPSMTLREKEITTAFFTRARVISGHMKFGVHLVGHRSGGFTYVTALRNPLKRVLSQWNWWVGEGMVSAMESSSEPHQGEFFYVPLHLTRILLTI